MRTCVITIVKNEHLYLNEWIKYHLDLGIEHIFVFEDFDSETHKSITDTYGDKVTLNNIFSILNEDDRKVALELKKTKKWNVQHIYLRNALKYVGSLNKFDWCFVIDADEFVTLEGDALDKVLPLYENHDAFIMLWKCYGADGHISKPDYTEKGVIETYTKEVCNNIIDKPQSLVKTCYNLKRYRPEFFHNQHRPSDVCKWCNTDLKRNIRATYSKIYIRHYVTKSWEEFAWKRIKRGFFWGKTRLFDMFFLANPEFVSMKKELIKNARKSFSCTTL